jgi:VWFA-related protein
LIDAIQLALVHMRGARNTRKAILVVSDGADNASRYSMGEIRKIVRESDVQIFAIAIAALGISMPSLFDAFGVGLLSDMSSETGGQTFEALSLKDLPRIASKIGVALRTQYVLGYVPEKAPKDGKFHRVKVQLAQSVPKKKLRLSWRVGYYAPSE